MNKFYMSFQYHQYHERNISVMVNKDLKKLNRTELIEIIYQLKKSEQELQEQINELQAELQDRRLKINQAGSIAEAALALSDIFNSAQEAADTYLNEIKRRNATLEAKCAIIIKEAQKKADAIIQEANCQKDIINQQCSTARAELHKIKEVLQSLGDELPLDN